MSYLLHLHIMVMADFSKVFQWHTTQMLIKNNVGDIKPSRIFQQLYPLNNQLSIWLVNDQKSQFADLHFGVPHGSIFGPVLLIYVADLIFTIVTYCAQHADDTTIYTTSHPGSFSQRGNSERKKDPGYEIAIYKNCEVLNIKQCLSNINSSLGILWTWSTNINLALNHKKTKTMLFATSQMENLHHKR